MRKWGRTPFLVATAVAICLAGRAAWSHAFPSVRTVVVQVERCEIAVMVGYRPASGEATDTILTRIASQPESQRLLTAKSVLTTHAIAPITIAIDGKPLVPTSVRAKIGLDSSGTRPIVVVLVTYAVPHAGSLSVVSRDPRSTRISWTDRGSGRVDPEHAPGQGRWFTGVASFLLTLRAPSCVASASSHGSQLSH